MGPNFYRAIEGTATGAAYSAGLCWASTCLVAGFRPADLRLAYWSALPYLRTDTCGIAAFLVTAVFLCTSEYLRSLRRARSGGQYAHDGLSSEPARSNLALLLLAFAKTAAVLSTGLVLYLSLNSVTHPATLNLQATHLITWPTEGTLRVAALAVCAVAAGTLRYSRAAWPSLTPAHTWTLPSRDISKTF